MSELKGTLIASLYHSDKETEAQEIMWFAHGHNASVGQSKGKNSGLTPRPALTSRQHEATHSCKERRSSALPGVIIKLCLTGLAQTDL